MFWLRYIHLFIYNTPCGIIQVTRSLVDRKERIQGVIDRDTLYCLLGEWISHAEEETSGHKGFQKKTPTDCPSILTLHTGLDRLCFLTPKSLSAVRWEEVTERSLELFVRAFFTVSLSISPQCFRASLRSLACPVLEKTVCASFLWFIYYGHLGHNVWDFCTL